MAVKEISTSHQKERNNNMLVNADYQKCLLKKWGAVLESGKKIERVEDKLIVAKVLENTYKFYKGKGYFTEAGTGNTIKPAITNPIGAAYDVSNGVLGPNDYILPNVVMPMLRRIFPTLMAHELVGVQPMNAPVGFAFALRVTGPNGGGYDPVGRNWEYGYHAPAATTGKAGAAMAIPNAKTTGAFSRHGTANLPAEGTGVASGEAEGFGNQPFGRFGASGVAAKYPMAAISFKHEAVVAEERKLGSEWSPEMAEDMEAMHGIDIETEMVNLMSFQLGSEIDQQILDSMIIASQAGGNTVLEWTPEGADGLDQMGRIATLLTSVTKAANDIAVTSRRGPGNFVVASVNVTSALQQLGAQKLVSDGKTLPSVPASSVGALNKEGLINDGRQLLVRDTYSVEDYALVGYKGTHPGDSGIIYCPYIPVTLVKTVDPYTLSPRIGARTRYGLLNNPFDAQNYYKLVKVDFAGAYQFGAANRYFFGGEANGYVQTMPETVPADAPQGAPAPKAAPAPAKK